MHQNQSFSESAVQDSIQVHLARAHAAIEKLRDQSFRAAWRDLYDVCPWATPYQSLAFIDAWVKHYQDDGEPVLVIGNDSQGRTKGVFGLINTNGALTSIGSHQAEYHAWLCDIAVSDSFAVAAIDALSRAFPDSEIRLKYLPSRLDANTLLDQTHLAERVRFVTHTRPLMRIDAEDLAKSFKKKSNKSRFNRLKKLGNLTFERINDFDRFSKELAQIRDQYDLRQGAVNDSVPFADDPHKEAFHTDWMRNAPDRLHVTVTRIDDQLVAAHIGAIGDGIVHLAIIAYSPFFARHSPGKLHLMQLGRLFMEEGIHTLDLTPGGDLWKDRFSNASDQVRELIVHTSANAKRRVEYSERMLAVVKSTATRIGLTPSRARGMLNAAKTATPRGIVHALLNLLPKKNARRIYRIDIEAIPDTETRAGIHRNNLGELVDFACSQTGLNRQSFLQSSLSKLERDAHIYTLGRHCAWLSKRQTKSYFPELHQEVEYPEGSALVYDFCSQLGDREQSLCEDMLHRMLQDLCNVDGVRHVYIAVPGNDTLARSAVETAGFEYQNTLSTISALGWKKKLQ